MSRGGAHRGARGSATVWVVVALGIAVSAGTGVLAVTSAAAARERAESAAALAARAGAAVPVPYPTDPCFRAALVAAANGAELVGCRPAAGAFEVRTRVALPPVLAGLGLGPAEGRGWASRAPGPARYPPG